MAVEPAIVIEWDLVQGQFPSFGARYVDVTRPGDTEQRFLYEGSRGNRAQLSGRRYFTYQADAQAFGVSCQAVQGNAVWVKDRLNNRWIAAFLHQISFEPLKRIGSSDGRDWAIIGTMDLQRLA